MKYFDIGKIAHSNNKEYIGKFFRISEINYAKIKEYMDKYILKDGDFESHLNDFSYHLKEEVSRPSMRIFSPEQERIILVPSKMGASITFILYLFYDPDNRFGFELFFNSKYPEMLPIDIYSKDILSNIWIENRCLWGF